MNVFILVLMLLVTVYSVTMITENVKIARDISNSITGETKRKSIGANFMIALITIVYDGMCFILFLKVM